MTHTPGPWQEWAGFVFKPGKDGRNICAVSELRAESVVGYTKPEIGTPNADEIWANARLIAAAPEMLEALKRCESRMSGHPMWDSEDAGPSQTLRMVRTAIAKAEIVERDLTKMEAGK